MPNKRVEIEVGTDVEDSEVDALEKQIQRLKQERLQFQIDTNTSKLEEVRARIRELENQKATLDVDADDSEIQKIDSEIEQLKFEEIDLDLKVRQDGLQQAESKVEELDEKQIDVELNMATQNFSQCLSTAKQGVQELYDSIKQVEEAGIQSEQNLAFLELNLGADKAKTTMQQISDIVAKMPGDDNTMRSVLSTAQALGNNLNPGQMEAATKTMADYMAGSATMGKMATESQQDIMKYLLDGNTAELERGSIVSSQVDKLKDANTFMERQAAMQEVLNELGYGGISTVDTMVNKQAEWEGMIYNSSDALSSMWLDAEKGAMDYILKLNDASGGLAGMAIVAGQMVAGPLTDIMGGISQIGMGFKTLKEAADFSGITGKLSSLKDALMNVGTKAKEAAMWMLDLGKKTLTAGANALKSAGMWVIQKAQLIATTIAEKAAAIAQWALNVAMSMNPIMLVVIAIGLLIAALAYLYFNNEQVRAAIDGLGQSLMALGQTIYDSVIGAWNSFISTIQMVWSSIVSFAQGIITTVMNAVNWVITSFLAGVAFLASLPGRIWTILSNIINKVISWGRSIASNFLSSASKSVSNFISYISQIPSKLGTELSNALNKVNEWAATLPQKFWDAGVNAVKNFLNALGIHSPGIMQRTLVWEISEMARRTPIEGKSLLDNVSSLGSDVVDEFGNPRFGLNFDDANTEFANGSIMGGQVINLNMEIGNVDSDDRIQEIVDAVRRELAWDNKTAGRTI
jgi:hypothetical protein